MITKIELDTLRISKYQDVKNNLEAVKEFFRHGDILLKQVNEILSEVKRLIDNNEETSFTKEDFDSMLILRNEVLMPIFQNASFAVQFPMYIDNIVEETPIEIQIELEPETITNTIVENNILIRSTTTTQLNGKILKTIDLSYVDSILTENSTIEYLENTTKSLKIKYDNAILVYHVETIISNGIVETIVTNLENGIAVSSTYTKYIDGIITENITTI